VSVKSDVVRLGVLGAGGKMGRMILQAALESPAVKLVAAAARAGSALVGEDAAALVGLARAGVPIVSDLEAVFSQAEVVIDFTAPAASAKAAARAAERKVALVIGTTGCAAAELQAIRRAAEEIPVVMSANMSLGVNVVLGLLQKAARALGADYDVEIVELHHRQKKDAPSGTALAMADEVARALGRDLEAALRHGRQGQVGARTAEEIGISAMRGGDVVGEHTAYFCGLGERIEISHRATSRAIFARGSVRAATWLVGRPAGLYDMRDVLGLEK
jgi:4-hydroxy-tetrahydrodipicolinate reductase